MMKLETACYQFDGVEVRPAAAEVRLHGKPLGLEPKAFRVLLYLIENRSRAVAKDELIEAVWDGAAVTDNALTRVIAQLRRELGDDARQPRYIQTLPTLGYRFVGDLMVRDAARGSPRRRRLYAVLAAGVLLAAGAGWLGWRVRPAPVRQFRPVQITTSPGLDVCGSFSPDGRAIVYSSNRSGRFEIYSLQLDAGARETRLTDDGRQNVEPAWSPDGQSIAYHSTALHGIWIVRAAGGTPRRVTEFGSSPAWSPDGKLIAFRSSEPFSFAPFDLAGLGDSTIWTVAPDGAGLRRVTNVNEPRGQHVTPSWSPDGRSIAFASLWRQPGGLWLVNADSGELSDVATGSLPFQANPVFTPDGGRLYFAAPSREGSGIYSVAVRGGAGPVEVYSSRQHLPLRMALSRDGSALTFVSGNVSSQLWRIAAGGKDHGPVFEDAVERARLPVFSPDGGRLAFIVQRKGSSADLWGMNPDGSGAMALAAGDGTEDAPSWDASGRAVLYQYSEGGRTAIRRVPAAGGASEVVVEDTASMVRPHVMPGGADVLYESGRPANLWMQPLRGGPPRQLTFDREGVRFPAVSPDGRWIAYEVNRGNSSQIGLIGRDGSSPAILTSEEGHHWPGSWSSDNRRLAISVFRDGAWSIWWIDRITGQRKQVAWETAFGSFVRSPAWRPNSEEMVYEHTRITGNIYRLDMR